MLRSYWVLVVLDQFTRRLVGVGVHGGAVTGADLCRMFNAAIHGRGAPRHLSTDHDPLFEAHRWTANFRILEIDEIQTVPHVPLSHPFVERLIGTMRWAARSVIRRPPQLGQKPRPLHENGTKRSEEIAEMVADYRIEHAVLDVTGPIRGMGKWHALEYRERGAAPMTVPAGLWRSRPTIGFMSSTLSTQCRPRKILVALPWAPVTVT